MLEWFLTRPLLPAFAPYDGGGVRIMTLNCHTKNEVEKHPFWGQFKLNDHVIVNLLPKPIN